MENDEIDLIEYWNVLKKWKRQIFFFVSFITVSSVIISLFLTKIYKADATLMPIGGGKSGGAAALAQVALGGMLGGLGGGGSNSSQIMAIFKSRTLAERVIDKYQLESKLFDHPNSKPPLEDMVKSLQSTITFTDDRKTTLINVSAIHKDPQFVADLVNNYIKEAMIFINENAFTSAKRNRLFIETQLEKVKINLLESGKELTEFYETNKISNVRPMIDVDVSLEKNENSHIEKLQKQVSEVSEKMKQAQVVKDVPQQVYLQYLTLRRELLGQVHGLLTQQYEMAKIEEQKEELSFQVIDWARVPVRKFKPKRAQIVMTAFVMSIFLGVFYAFFREYLEKLKTQEAS